MANRYLITGGGNVIWNASDTAIWSETSGGATGASVPGASDAVIMDASSGGGKVTLGYNPTVTSIAMGAFTGEFDASTYSPTMATFNCSGTGVRTLSMGSGTWTITGNNATIWDTGTTTGLTVSGSADVVCSYAGATGSRTFTVGGVGVFANNTGTVKITGGTDTFQTNGTATGWQSIDFTGFSGIWASTSTTINFRKNITLSGTMTNNVTATIAYNGTTGTGTWTSNGISFGGNVTINGVGGTLTLGDAINLTGASNTLTLTAGTFNANNFNVTCGIFSSSNSNTRTLTKGTGTWTLTGTGTVWNTATTTGLTFTDGGTTKITNEATAAGCTFSGGGLSYNTLWIARGANTQSNTLVGNNKFITLKDDGSEAHSLLFTAGSTTSANNFEVSGTAGKLITLNSTTTGTFNLIATEDRQERDYLNIQHSIATPAFHWYAGNNSVDNQADDVAGSGWVFTDAPTPGPNGLLLSSQECLNILAGKNDTIQNNLATLTNHTSVDATAITPISIKGGVIRNIDQATGGVQKTTAGFVEDEKYGIVFSPAAGETNFAEFLSGYAGGTGDKVIHINTSVASAGNPFLVYGYNAGTSATLSVPLLSKYGIPLSPSTVYKITMRSQVVDRSAGSNLTIFSLHQYASSGSRITNTSKTTTSTNDADFVEYTTNVTTDANVVWGVLVFATIPIGETGHIYVDWNSTKIEPVSTITNSLSTPVQFYPKVTAVTSTDNIDQSQVDVSSFTGPNDVNWRGQTFTPTKKNHTGVTLTLLAEGTPPNDLVLELVTVDGSNKPTSTVLSTVNITAASLTSSYQEKTYSLPYTLTIGSLYAYRIYTSGGNTSNRYRLRASTTSVYSGGILWLSGDSGVTWSDSSQDLAFKTLYSKNTTNFTVRTDTETLSVTAPTVEGWENGEVIDSTTVAPTFKGFTLAPGANTFYLSSNGSNLADSDTDESLQATLGGVTGNAMIDASIQDLANIWAETEGLSTQEAINSKAGTTGLSIQEALNILAD